MPKPQNTTNGEFFCRGLTIHFIYSFSLSKKPESDDKVNYVIDPSIALQCHSNNVKKVDIGNPDRRMGILPHIVFTQDEDYTDSAYIDFESIDATIREYDVTINRLVRIFRTACTCTISIEIARHEENIIDTKNILQLLGLVRLKTIDEQNTSRDIIQFRNTLGDMLWSETESIYSIFFKTLQELENHCEEENIRLLGSVNKMVDLEAENQTPWVVTITEVDGEIEKAFCRSYSDKNDPSGFKMRAIRNYEKDIAPIVFRSVGPKMFLEPAYTDPPTPNELPGLYNMGLDARLYINISRRSALCICENKDEDPARFFLPDLLNICEIVRARWHMLILMNRVLDITMKEIREDSIKDDGHTVRTKKREAEDHVYTFMTLKDWLSTSSEDPGIYVVAGDALSRLNDHLVDTFRIEELRGLVMNKLDLMERIYNDLQEWRWLKSPYS